MTDDHNGVSLREYIERILEENRKALVVAEQEREKSARALREQLSERIRTGDKALEEHITQQVASVRAALVAQEKLSSEIQRAQQEAVDKALMAQKEQANKHNDLIHAAERRDEAYATKVDMDTRIGYLRDAIDRLNTNYARLAGGAVVASVLIATILRLAHVGS